MKKNIEKIINFAVLKHQNKYRADNKTPYLVHICEVVNMLQSWNINDEDILSTAYLHDVIEKTDTDVSELDQFGNKIKANVLLITHDENKISKEQYFFLNRKNVVKLADHLTNTLFFIKNKIRNPITYYQQGKVLIDYFKDKYPYNKTIKYVEEKLK